MTRMKMLSTRRDLLPEEIARLHGPIGLDLGGKSPAEIAVAIVAEIVAVKNGVAECGHTWMGYDWGADTTTVLFGGYAGSGQARLPGKRNADDGISPA